MTAPLREPVPYVVRFSEPMLRQERELAASVAWLFFGQSIDGDASEPVRQHPSLRPAFVFPDGNAAARFRAAMGYLWETAGRQAGMLSAVSEPL